MRTLAPLFGLFLLPACDLFAEKDVAEDGPSCTETATVLSLDDATDLDFSGADVLAVVAGTHTGTFVWSKDGHTEGLTLTVGDTPTEVRFIDSVPIVDPDADLVMADEVQCPNRVEIDVPVSFATETGAFDESWSSTILAYSLDEMGMTQDLDYTAMGGSYDLLSDVESTDYDTLRFGLQASFSPDGTSGTVSGQASGSEDCDPGDVCSAWAEMIDVGSW